MPDQDFINIPVSYFKIFSGRKKKFKLNRFKIKDLPPGVSKLQAFIHI